MPAAACSRSRPAPPALVIRNNRAYLYHSIRRDGQVTSRYVASGLAAIWIHDEEWLERDGSRYRREAVREEIQEIDNLERGLDEIVECARASAEAHLNRCGYYQHDRGAWRKRHARRGDREAGTR
jgi:hypothetical protein